MLFYELARISMTVGVTRRTDNGWVFCISDLVLLVNEYSFSVDQGVDYDDVVEK